MKRLLLVALMIQVTLIGISSAADDVMTQTVTRVIGNTPRSLDAISHDQINVAGGLQARANLTTGAVTELQATVNDGDEYSSYYDLYKGAFIDLPGTVDTGVTAKSKMYYLTVTSFTGGDAIKACDPRFHMAKISEIQDPSNLQYATSSITIYDSLVDDPGLGPPADRMGWVRSDSLSLAGVPDYGDFSMSSFDQQNGITAAFHVRNIWGDLSLDPFSSDPMTGWQAAQRLLSHPQPVWCVEDPE